MHGRIYEIREDKIPQAEWVTEGDFWDDSFVGSVADYVVARTGGERHKDIERLRTPMKGVFEISHDGGGYTLKLAENGRYEYFGERFEKLKSAFADMTLDEFCDSYKMYHISTPINDTFGAYVYGSDGWDTLDDFIRQMRENEIYYIGGTLDYHY